MLEIKGEIERIVFLNIENGYCIARAKIVGESGVATLVGILGNLSPGEIISAQGSWKEHLKFGRQFDVVQFEQVLPANLAGIEKYLASGKIKGIGLATAKRLVDKFGEKTFDILDLEPERLAEIDGFGTKKIEKIKKSWQEQRAVRNLMLFLQSHDISPTLASRIFEQYGAEATKIIKTNPYQLAYDLRRVGFMTADALALKLGFLSEAPERIEAGLIYALYQESDRGHLFFPKSELFLKASKLLRLQNENELELLEIGLSSLEQQKKIMINDLPEQNIEQAIYLPFFYKMEREIVARLLSLGGGLQVSPETIEKAVAEVESKAQFVLSTEQREAVLRACAAEIFILTGGPGTGKTTIVRTIAHALRKLGLIVRLAAPTGRAAKRMSESTGYPATTLHRLLKVSHGFGFEFNEEKKLPIDIIIVDETSMLDCALFLNLLRALPLTCRLILVGDQDQLPSVGAGNVLRDCISSGAIEVQRLTHIFRQAKESMIVTNAYRINQGLMPQSSTSEEFGDFWWVNQENPQKIQEMVLDAACVNLPAKGFDPFKDIQVLTPMHKGELGTIVLNTLLQERLNKNEIVFLRGDKKFKIGDKVLQTVNNYEKDVFNGDLGLVAGKRGDELIVNFDGNNIYYEPDEIEELNLAYAISVHKAQGSEYKAVIFPVVSQHYILLQRNLIYTALTRAKEFAAFIGMKRAMQIGISSIGKNQRYTHLAYLLKN